MVTIDREWPQVWSGGTAYAGRPLVHGLIGRAREIALIDDLLATARTGTSGALAFRGWPGVGKTGIIQAAVARASGFSVLQLRGTRDQLLQSAHENHPLAPLLDQLDAGPEVVERTALDALRAVVRASDRPLLVVVDDCHLLPDGLPGVLVRAAANAEVGGPVAVVLAWRATPYTGCADLGLPSWLRVRELAPLGYNEAEELFRRLEMHVPVRRVLECMVDATAGTPWALIETHGLLTGQQLLGERPIPWPMPIDAKLAGAFDLESILASEEGRLAAGVAALGAPTSVTVDALEELGLSLSSLGEAQRAGVLRVLGDQIDFDHALVRAAAFAILPKTARDAVQLAVSNAYERLGDVQHSAFHAGMSGDAPTDVVVRRYAAAARYAMDCGRLDHAAIYQEIASEHAGTRDATAWHLATAAGLWLAIDDDDRARGALAGARSRATTDETRALVLYQDARLRLAASAQLPEDAEPTTPSAQMQAAAALCQRTAPQRAASMLVDSVACRIFQSQGVGALDIAEEALALAVTVNGHVEALAQAALAAACTFANQPVGPQATGWRWTTVLESMMQEGPPLPQLAFVLGQQLVLDNNHERARHWASALARAATAMGNTTLKATASALQAWLALQLGDPQEAIRLAEKALDSGDQQIVARALVIQTQASAACGRYRQGFESASRLFALVGSAATTARLSAMTSLAQLELQQAPGTLASAWLSAAMGELGALAHQRAEGSWDVTQLMLAVSIAELMVITGRDDELRLLVDLTERAAGSGPAGKFWMSWLRELADAEDEALPALKMVASALEGLPLVASRVQLATGVKLARKGRLADAMPMFDAALGTLRAVHADGWVAIAERAVAEVTSDAPAAPWAGGTAPARPVAPHTQRERVREGALLKLGVQPGPPGVAHHEPASSAEWHIEVLGAFAIRRRGTLIQMPHSLATQALMILSLRRRIPVEELVEILWPDAEPGVGLRRLRNVLWRIRVACGDLLHRDGNFIRLADDVIVDEEVFRQAAATALKRTMAPAEAADLARTALQLYHGEVLPGERYADWATGRREAAARLHIQVLEFLLADAMRNERVSEALEILEQLIECDPYEEQHHLQLAEIYARNGSRARALRVIERAARVLEELEIPPSESLAQARRALSTAMSSEESLPV